MPRLTRALKRNTATSYRLTIHGAAHLTFMDGPLYLPPVPSIVGSLGRTESPRVVAATALAFLDTTLRHNPGDLPGVLSAYGDLSVYHPEQQPLISSSTTADGTAVPLPSRSAVRGAGPDRVLDAAGGGPGAAAEQVGGRTGWVRSAALRFLEAEARFPGDARETPVPAVPYAAQQVRVPAAGGPKANKDCTTAPAGGLVRRGLRRQGHGRSRTRPTCVP